MKAPLSTADQARFGAPEWLDVDIDTVTVRECEAIEEATGLTYEEAVALMLPEVEEHEDRRTLRFRPKGVRIRVWLGLRRAGIETPYDELDFDYGPWGGLRVFAREPEGKAVGSPPAEPNTQSKSPSTGRTRSKRSATST